MRVSAQYPLKNVYTCIYLTESMYLLSIFWRQTGGSCEVNSLVGGLGTGRKLLLKDNKNDRKSLNDLGADIFIYLF